jgi:cytochrome c556
MRAKTIELVLGVTVMAGFAACAGSAPPPETAAPVETAPAQSSAAEPEEPAPTQTAAAEVTPPPPKPDVPPEGSSLDRIMQAHFKDALLIRQSVIDGKPEQAAQAATVIANIKDLDKLPEGWQPFVEHMQETAKRFRDSTTAAAAAGAAADLGVSCGLCHQKHGGPKPSTDPLPPMGTTIETRMQRHIWATERLWEALALPSNDAWKAGVNALSTEPFPKEFLKEGGVDVRTSANDFTKLVGKASAKKTTEQRAELYAELLVTCGTCHQASKRDQK